MLWPKRVVWPKRAVNITVINYTQLLRTTLLISWLQASQSLYPWKITNHDNHWASLVNLPYHREFISTVCAITVSGDWCIMQTSDVMYIKWLIYLIRCRNHLVPNASVDEKTISIVTWHWNSPRNINISSGSAPKAHYIVLFVVVAVRTFRVMLRTDNIIICY